MSLADVLSDAHATIQDALNHYTNAPALDRIRVRQLAQKIDRLRSNLDQESFGQLVKTEDGFQQLSKD